MSNSQLKQSLRDIIPTLEGIFPTEVISCADTLYLLSLQQKPVLANRAEIGRYHICAYLAAEKYQEALGLPEPSLTKIPLQPKVATKLLDDFRENLLFQIRSATSTPRSSPRKAKSTYSTPISTPTRVRDSQATTNTPKISSPLKRLQELRDSTPKRQKPSEFKDVESPFNPKATSQSPSQSAQSLPSKKPVLYKYDRKHVTIVDFISFANNFFVPSTITPRMVETFLVHRHKFAKKSEWLLACGMVHAAYTRINHTLLLKMGAKLQLNNQLFQYQKGGLMKKNMQLWNDIVDDWIKQEPWILDLEQQYMYQNLSKEESKLSQEKEARIGPGWELMADFGAMITGDILYDSNHQNDYYDTWTGRVLSQL